MSSIVDSNNSEVYLGFGYTVEPHLSFRLQSHYMPLGKIGGKPAWLNPVNLPSYDSLLCRVCKFPTAFLLQVYATNSADEDYSFHRTLFIFICRNSDCSKSNDASNVRAFRCMLPRHNDYYPDQALDPDFDIKLSNPFIKSYYPNLCEICGCGATKKCSRCESVWYCCRAHQLMDWSGAHKTKCKQSGTAVNGTTLQDSEKEKNSQNDVDQLDKSENVTAVANLFTFPEYAIEMDIEKTSKGAYVIDSDESESDSEADENSDGLTERRMEEYRQYMTKHKPEVDLPSADLEDTEEQLEKDIAFKKFNKIVSVNAEQVLRYERGGQPLLATDRAPHPEDIPYCDLCGSRRQFELQLMPNLLSLIGVDEIGKSIDWATLMLYTCSRNCRITGDAYAEEFAFKQDFT